jgi:hypothetical protein
MDGSREEKSEAAAKDTEFPRSLMARLAALAREQALASDKKRPPATPRGAR